MKGLVIFDIDGTLSDSKDRVKYLQQEPKDYESFYMNCIDDEEIAPICEMCRMYEKNGYEVMYLTGRKEKCRDLTAQWLKDHNLPDGDLLMRRNHDYTQDYQYKQKSLLKYLEQRKLTLKDVFVVFDDRDQCVQMFRDELGLICVQPRRGDY